MGQNRGGDGGMTVKGTRHSKKHKENIGSYAVTRCINKIPCKNEGKLCKECFNKDKYEKEDNDD